MIPRALTLGLILAGVFDVRAAPSAEVTSPKPAAGLVFACREDNDLYRVLTDGRAKLPRHDSPAAAVAAAPEGAGVLILADGYPEKTTDVEPAGFDEATRKHLRLYVEYPSQLPDLPVGRPKEVKCERGVVTSEMFGTGLAPMRIVMLNGGRCVPVEAQDPHVVLAKVAGVDTAVFGLKDTPTEPLLFDHPRGNLLVATSKLSHFVRGRYLPAEAWRTIWQTILGRLQPGAPAADLSWTQTVRPSYGPEEPLPADAERQALHRSADWIVHSRILRHPSWPQEVLDRALRYNTVRDMPPADWPLGDGSLGILEGFSSTIRADGGQPMRYAVRNDCTGETSLIQTDGDPVCDMLYSCNFALIGLHEAAAATGEPFYAEAEAKLARFLCRIQVRSQEHPELDGAWYRAFNFRRWEYWASNSDWEWGPWCIETGWCQPWIAGTLALRQQKTSLWDLVQRADLRKPFDRLRRQMLPDEALAVPELNTSKIAHAALNKPVRLAVEADPRYPGFGPEGLTDGILGEANHGAAQWLGFMGTDLEAVVDLGAPTTIRRLGLNCLQSTRLGIFLPKEVEYAVSRDGKQFQVVKKIETRPPAGHVPVQTQTLAADGLDVEGRYVRVRAAHLGPLPEWVVRGSVPAWLFVDEVVVNPDQRKPSPAAEENR